jgi:transcriptional regulator of acetoin/glycerol metabolism
MNKMMDVLRENARVIQIVNQQISLITKSMNKSIVFILTNINGVVLAVHGREEMINKLDIEQNLGIGTSFIMEHAGVNAISVAKELKEDVFVRGSEHNLKMFSEWSCFCGPIRSEEGIIAYLDMSFAKHEDHFLAGLVFDLVMRNIHYTIQSTSPVLQKEKIYDNFNNFKLSPREKEIGYGWLMNHSALRMAKELGIVEGTVRNVLKNVYRKTGVCDKGQFIRRFMP